MRQPLFNPGLLPDQRPLDVAVSDPAELLNPPHIGRVLATESHPNESGPDWSLLTQPAA